MNGLSPANASQAASAAVYSHTVHGLITIQLVDAPRTAVEELEYMLGPSHGQPAGEPDIRIRYGRVPGAADELRYLGLHESAYGDDQFYVLNDRSRRFTFDFERLGEPVEFLCEPGASPIPYLLPVIGLRLLRKGYVMLHASSFVYEGRGVLVAGWQKGGKTEALLAFMAQGAQYLADEWTIISPADGKMWGVPGTLKIWEWHLRYLPEYWQRLRPMERNRLRAHRLYQRTYRRLPATWRGRGFLGERLERMSMDGGVAFLGLLQSSPERLFGADRMWQGPAPVDALLLAGVGSEVRLTPITPADVARRMAASLAYERASLLPHYEQFRFAFPDRRNVFLETAPARDQELLERALQGRPAYEILHPYPVPLRALYAACEPAICHAAPTAGERPHA